MKRGVKGSVSVFIIMIIVPIFLFQAVLVEFARSKLAEQQIEMAVKAAMRSVGSLYDTQLQTYGLYGVAGDGTADEIFQEVIRGNTGHGFANTAYLSANLSFERSLSDPEIFKNQVLEDMKIRAPLEYARQVTNKLRNTGISQAMNEFSDFSKTADQMDKLANKRDEAMRRVWKSVDDADDWISDSFQDLLHQVESLEPEHSRMQELDVAELRDRKRRLKERLSDQRKQAESDEERIKDLEDDLDDIDEELDEYEDWLDELEAMSDRHRDIAQQVEQIHEGLLQALSDAESYNDQLREHMESWTSEMGSELIQSVQLMAEGDFAHIRSKTTGFTEQLQSLSTSFAGLKNGSPYRLQSQMDEYLRDWGGWMRQADDAEAAQKEREQRLQEEKRAAEQQFEDQVNLLLQKITGCNPETAEEERTLYSQLAELTDEQENAQSGDYDEEHYALDREADDDAVSMSQMIGQLTERVTETMYVNEYALTSFNYRTLGNEKDRHGRKLESVTSLANPAQHPLPLQEAEYILYGFHSCAGNYSAAYWEVFAFRLAVRTTESLMSPKNSWKLVGSPLVAFLWALAEGAVHAYRDVEQLADGYEVPISSKIAPSLTWNYKDYLRLFLLLHGQQDRYLQRMQALIELNTGADLSEHYTYWRSEAHGSLQSLFLDQYSYEPKVESAWGYY